MLMRSSHQDPARNEIEPIAGCLADGMRAWLEATCLASKKSCLCLACLQYEAGSQKEVSRQVQVVLTQRQVLPNVETH
jgi:hypothetical protein